MTDIKPVAWYDDDLEIHYGPTHPVFTVTGWQPLYPESALLQAREEGRLARMREAFLAGYETAHNHTVEGAYAPELSADDYIDESPAQRRVNEIHRHS